MALGIPWVNLGVISWLNGASLPGAAGHREWVAADGDDSIRLAVGLVQLPVRLAEARIGLRGQLARRSLLDTAGRGPRRCPRGRGVGGPGKQSSPGRLLRGDQGIGLCRNDRLLAYLISRLRLTTGVSEQSGTSDWPGQASPCLPGPTRSSVRAEWTPWRRRRR